MSMDTPLLLIAWRRPHTLRQVIDAIRPVAPRRLFVATGGPNSERPGEAEKVAATRAVIKQVEEGINYIRQPISHRRGFRITVNRWI